MAERPVFRVCMDKKSYVLTNNVKFIWHAGLSIGQKKKCIKSLHDAYNAIFPKSKVLEVSTKSDDEIGVALSAFNLGVPSKDNSRIITVECLFQGSKVFENGGPYTDLYYTGSLKAKKDRRLKDSGNLIGFNFFGQDWPLIPKTLFYDWIYLNSLYKNKFLHDQIFLFDAFTDIEFNPKKSINCQAKSLALFVSLFKRGILDKTIKSKDAYIDLFCSHNDFKLDCKLSKQLLIPNLGFDAFSQ